MFPSLNGRRFEMLYICPGESGRMIFPFFKYPSQRVMHGIDLHTSKLFKNKNKNLFACLGWIGPFSFRTHSQNKVRWWLPERIRERLFSFLFAFR
jgi:hypothetical protein